MVSQPKMLFHSRFIRRVLALLFIFALALSVRGLTANFLRAHLTDPGWFPFGIYSAFDRQAQDALDGRASFFRIDDPSRTDKAVYPPGYPLWLAFIYELSGHRSPAVVQKVQWILDSFAVLLIVGIGATAFGWRIGLWAGGIAALWPLLASYGAVPLADAPTSWVVLGATWMLLLAVKRQSFRWALGAGTLVGVSCWLRANAMLLVFFWALALLLLVRASWRRRALLSAGVVLAAMIVIAPVLVRNLFAFRAFVPTGLGAGTNLLEGIGETQRGASEFGAAANDIELIEQERAELKVPPDAPFDLYYPDGIRRDRERTRKALAIIIRHPFWYAGSVAGRMVGVMKYAGEPSGIYGSAGVNVTSKKSLPPAWQGGALALHVNALGMLQSVLRYVLLPLMLVGLVLAFRLDWRVSALIMSTVFYYLVVGSIIHTHIRYGLPMHALLTIFAGVAVCWLSRKVTHFRRARKS
ncbi:MAG TPA: glycosyltransferase family 39 protein [Pyrinomonadaceae bacterium]|nr:glycosyltransferase family 39 protein [Pyrinomonadaceae bacterium]